MTMTTHQHIVLVTQSSFCTVRPQFISPDMWPANTRDLNSVDYYIWGMMQERVYTKYQVECGPMPNVMVALPNIGGALCSTPQSLADAHY